MSYEGGLDPLVANTRRVFCCHKALLSGKYVGNSLEAVSECASANVPRLEIDVQFLADDSMIVYHDEMLERESTGIGPVMSLDRLRAGELRYRGDGTVRIAFIEEVVDLLRTRDCLLQVDLKLLSPITVERTRRLAEALRPLGTRAIIGSQAHWNVRPFAGLGPVLAFDPTWHWNKFGCLTDGVGPVRKTAWGHWDDAPLAQIPGISGEEYVRERIKDIAALVPFATEWMVDYEMILHLSAMAGPLGDILREHGINLTAWTLKDRGREASEPLMRSLFAAGATTMITDDSIALAGYVRD